MVSPSRVTVAFDEETPVRLRAVAAKFEISIARLLSCLLALPDEKIKEAIDENYPKLFKSAKERNEKRKELMSVFKGMTVDQIEVIVGQVKKDQS